MSDNFDKLSWPEQESLLNIAFERGNYEYVDKHLGTNFASGNSSSGRSHGGHVPLGWLGIAISGGKALFSGLFGLIVMIMIIEFTTWQDYFYGYYFDLTKFISYFSTVDMWNSTRETMLRLSYMSANMGATLQTFGAFLSANPLQNIIGIFNILFRGFQIVVGFIQLILFSIQVPFQIVSDIVRYLGIGLEIIGKPYIFFTPINNLIVY